MDFAQSYNIKIQKERETHIYWQISAIINQSNTQVVADDFYRYISCTVQTNARWLGAERCCNNYSLSLRLNQECIYNNQPELLGERAAH